MSPREWAERLKPTVKTGRISRSWTVEAWAELAQHMADFADLLESRTASGRSGGLVGGRARAEALSPARRSEIAREAARKRWESSE